MATGMSPAQRIKTAYLKHKTLYTGKLKPAVCLLESGQATTARGGAAEEAIADEERGAESESDGAPDSPTGIWFLKSSVLM